MLLPGGNGVIELSLSPDGISGSLAFKPIQSKEKVAY
jgi:hypothetical protein